LRRRATAAAGAGLAGLALLVAGCSADRIERGVFHSIKGYRVSLPPNGWAVEPRGNPDLEMRRLGAPGGILADATCGGKPPRRSLELLARYLVFGLGAREVLEDGAMVVAGRDGVRRVVRGRLDGAPVTVEAVVLKDERCVYDFLYVAPADAFEAGRADFRAFVESFSSEAR
jgi:hypothetical protein